MSIDKPEASRFERRRFLKQAGLASLGSLLAGCRPSASELQPPQPTLPMAKIGLQLWTVREQLENDFEGTLRRIAEMGYAGVETAFLPEDISLETASQLLKDTGLEVLASHVELPVGENREAMLRTAEAYNSKKMVWHGWPEDVCYHTRAGTDELIAIYNDCNSFAQANGLEFGLHNHWWEFEQHDGIVPFDYLLEHLDASIFFEIDTYWAKVAGRDPAQAVSSFGARAPLLHIKDGQARWTEALDADNPEPMVAVGKGSQNFPAVVEAAAGNTQWMIVELDQCATDMMEAVEESYAYLSGYGLGIGTV